MNVMGEILERVQNKFACIIGELCSEPVVLSKFAIWLDLRLAEYKAKGAISLDGFGENPDPTWLKGHEKDEIEDQRPQVDDGLVSSQNYPFQGGGASPENSLDRGLEPQVADRPLEVVYVEEESLEESQSDCMYTATVSPSHNTGTDVLMAAKRRSSEALNIPKSDDLRISPVFKSRRLLSFNNVSSPSYNHERTNQSLMSIIGDSEDNADLSVTDNDFSHLSNPDTSTPFSQFRGGNSAEARQGSGEDHLLPVPSFPSFQSPGTSDLNTESTSSSPGLTCPACGKMFTRRFCLQRHLRVHDRYNKPFQCPTCGGRFREKHHLKRHREARCVQAKRLQVNNVATPHENTEETPLS